VVFQTRADLAHCSTENQLSRKMRCSWVGIVIAPGSLAILLGVGQGSFDC
jgi:hypothetical protein